MFVKYPENGSSSHMHLSLLGFYMFFFFYVFILAPLEVQGKGVGLLFWRWAYVEYWSLSYTAIISLEMFPVDRSCKDVECMIFFNYATLRIEIYEPVGDIFFQTIRVA